MTVTTPPPTDGTADAAPGPLSPDELDLLDAYWRAANYLSVGQIYLLANPLLREPLQLQHVKPRLLGPWGTTPGLNLIYAHLNRVIVPGHRTTPVSSLEDRAPLALRVRPRSQVRGVSAPPL